MKKGYTIILFSLFGLCNHVHSQNLIWARQLGGVQSQWEDGLGIDVDGNGNVYITGYLSDSADFDPGSGTYYLTCVGGDDFFITKLDASGSFVWAKSMGGTSWDHGQSTAVDQNGSVYTTGTFNSTVDFDPDTGVYNLTALGSDLFISKLDSSGNFVWARHSEGVTSANEYARCIAIDFNENVYISGYFGGTVDFDPGPGIFNLTSTGYEDIFVLKLDSSGNFLWAIKMGGSKNDRAFSFAVDKNANILLTGSFEDTADFDPGISLYTLISSGMEDIFITKLDSTGSLIWAKQMGNQGIDEALSVAVDTSGNVFTTGYYDGIVDFDPGSGIYNLMQGNSGHEIFVSKLDSSGNFVWAGRLGGDTYDQGYCIAVDDSGNVYTSGYFTGIADFDPGLDTFNLGSGPSGDEIFVSKLTAAGNFGWAIRTVGTAYEYGRAITVDAAGNIYLTGNFQGTTDFNPGLGIYNLTSYGGGDAYVIKLGASTTGIESAIPNSQSAIYIFPNPAANKITISNPQSAIEEIKIYNVMGQKVFQSAIAKQQSTITIGVEEWNKGIYVVKVSDGEKQVMRKVIVQ